MLVYFQSVSKHALDSVLPSKGAGCGVLIPFQLSCILLDLDMLEQVLNLGKLYA